MTVVGFPVEGEWAGGVTGLREQRVEIAMMRTPHVHSPIDVARWARFS